VRLFLLSVFGAAFWFCTFEVRTYTTPCKPDKISCLVPRFLQAAYMHMLIRASITDIKGIAIRAVQYGLDCVRKCNAEHSTSTSGRNLSCTPGNISGMVEFHTWSRGTIQHNEWYIVWNLIVSRSNDAYT
jgi:hypothetical protein